MRTARQDSALALNLWPESMSNVVKSVLLVAVGIALLTLSAKIQVPVQPVPVTLQTFAVMAIAAAYGSRLALTTVVAYLAAGFAGLPVFAGLAAGPAYVLGPTAGFLFGFIPLAIIVGLAADRGWDRSVLKLFAAMVVADIVVFAMGFTWLAFFAQVPTGMGIGPARAFSGAIQPFVVADLVKIALAASLVPAMWAIIDRTRSPR